MAPGTHTQSPLVVLAPVSLVELTGTVVVPGSVVLAVMGPTEVPLVTGLPEVPPSVLPLTPVVTPSVAVAGPPVGLALSEMGSEVMGSLTEAGVIPSVALVTREPSSPQAAATTRAGTRSEERGRRGMVSCAAIERREASGKRRPTHAETHLRQVHMTVVHRIGPSSSEPQAPPPSKVLTPGVLQLVFSTQRPQTLPQVPPICPILL